MTEFDFDRTYNRILHDTVDMLKNDRFAVIVVGNYRDKKGYLRDLVGITVNCMEDAGAKYYNDIIYAQPLGSLPIRAGVQFKKSRKIGRAHQYVLVFVKGDPNKATERLGNIDIPDMSEYIDACEI